MEIRLRHLYLYFRNRNEMAKVSKQTKRGRPEIPEGDRKKRIPISAAEKTHDAIVEKFKDPIERFEKKLIKELDK